MERIAYNTTVFLHVHLTTSSVFESHLSRQRRNWRMCNQRASADCFNAFPDATSLAEVQLPAIPPSCLKPRYSFSRREPTDKVKLYPIWRLCLEPRVVLHLRGRANVPSRLEVAVRRRSPLPTSHPNHLRRNEDIFPVDLVAEAGMSKKTELKYQSVARGQVAIIISAREGALDGRIWRMELHRPFTKERIEAPEPQEQLLLE